MRGKVSIGQMRSYLVRITPAHAGKSRLQLRGYCAAQDHPRPCGEKLKAGQLPGAHPGSPPPMRGKGHRAYGAARSARITPAHAGKRSSIFELKSSALDHPRPCGEKARVAPSISPEAGSPPPMRGKVTEHIIRMCMPWITPAHAGKRLMRF